jgi:hypothetical protein
LSIGAPSKARPDDNVDAEVARARRTSARTLDPTLPDRPLEEWLGAQAWGRPELTWRRSDCRVLTDPPARAFYGSTCVDVVLVDPWVMGADGIMEGNRVAIRLATADATETRLEPPAVVSIAIQFRRSKWTWLDSLGAHAQVLEAQHGEEQREEQRLAKAYDRMWADIRRWQLLFYAALTAGALVVIGGDVFSARILLARVRSGRLRPRRAYVYHLLLTPIGLGVAWALIPAADVVARWWFAPEGMFRGESGLAAFVIVGVDLAAFALVGLVSLLALWVAVQRVGTGHKAVHPS